LRLRRRLRDGRRLRPGRPLPGVRHLLLSGGPATAAGVTPRRRRPGLGALTAVGALTAAGFLAFLLPARESLLRLVAAKRSPLELVPETIAGVARLQAGTAEPLLAALFWLLAAAGLARLVRRDAALALYAATLVAVQVAGLLALSPEMLVHPMMFDRYLIPSLPWVLLWVAAALALPWSQAAADGSSMPRWQAAAAAAVVAALVLAGPLARESFRRGSFVHHNDFVAFFCPPARLAAGEVPRLYAEVIAREPEAPVVEYPWHRWWTYTRAVYVYQRAHGRDVVVAPWRPFPGEERLRFRNTAFPTPEAILDSRGRWLVVHTDLPAEEDRVDGHCWAIRDDLQPHVAARLERRGRRVARQLEARWGPPDHREGTLLVWDLERLRRDEAPAGGG
jgi:hypothetical protein